MRLEGSRGNDRCGRMWEGGVNVDIPRFGFHVLRVEEGGGGVGRVRLQK